MTEPQSNSPTDQAEPHVAGLLAEFTGPEALRAAASGVRDGGYRRWDAHSPFPIHGMERAMGIRPTILPWLVLGAGIGGAAAALLLQWWTNAVDYPFLISGKPLFSLPANIPVTFELIVLFSAFAAFGGVFVLNLLPQYWHPAFSARRFARVTTDGFFISVEASDPKFDLILTKRLLESLGATAVEVCFAPAAGRRVPRALIWTLVVVAALAVLPPLWIARVRQVPSTSPRVHIIQDMDFQPRYQAQGVGPFFADQRATRPPVPNAVAVGGLETDSHYFRGQVGGKWATTFPIRVDMEHIQRGRERFNIYCSTCHGLAGEGDGMVHLRAMKRGEPGWVQPRSLQVPAVREQPAGQLFNTITHGLNTMPGYAPQIPVEDRWAIVLYEKALQRSQNAGIDDVPAELRPAFSRGATKP
jgi:mono/diheme cytochrome c family protein